MGGIGSRRHWSWGAKNSTDAYRSIDMRCWERNGGLAPHQSFVYLVVQLGRGSLGYPRAYRIRLGDLHLPPPERW